MQMMIFATGMCLVSQLPCSKGYKIASVIDFKVYERRSRNIIPTTFRAIFLSLRNGGCETGCASRILLPGDQRQGPGFLQAIRWHTDHGFACRQRWSLWLVCGCGESYIHIVGDSSRGPGGLSYSRQPTSKFMRRLSRSGQGYFGTARQYRFLPMEECSRTDQSCSCSGNAE